MKSAGATMVLVLILLGFVASGTANAGPYGHRGHLRFSLIVGAPIGWYYGAYGYYPPPYHPLNYAPYHPLNYAPYYAPLVAAPYTPPTYVEQANPQAIPAPQASPSAAGYWYFCAESKAYYPYVNQCPGGWQRVSPTPPPG